MKIARLLTMVSAAALIPSALIPSALAQDVPVFSSSDAEAVLADPPAAASAGDACPVRLPNGTCARTTDERAFRLVTPKGKVSGSQPSASPTPTSTPRSGYGTSRNKTTTGTRSRLSSPASSREVPLQFSVGSFELSPQSKANLTALATALLTPTNAAKRIRVTGHTDRSGSLATNTALSQRRAETAADFMASQGVERARIEAVGRGFAEPLAGFSSRNPRHRRVEVVRID